MKRKQPKYRLNPAPRPPSAVLAGSAKFRCYVCSSPDVAIVWALNEDADRGFFCCEKCVPRLDAHFSRGVKQPA